MKESNKMKEKKKQACMFSMELTERLLSMRKGGFT